MQFDRVVQVRAVGAGPKASFGTGYLVAPRLILTAAHIAADKAGHARSRISVCLPDRDTRQFVAEVRWLVRGEAVDAALVEIVDENWDVPQSLVDAHTRPPLRWGWLATTNRYEAQARGFPSLQRDAAGRQLDEQLFGQINPGTGALSRRYEILSADPLPSAPPVQDAPSRWAGFSGSAVFCADLLVGVARQDRRADGGARLTATRSLELLADPEFRRVVHEHTGWDPMLEAVEFAPLLAPSAVERDLRSTAALLRADVEAVRFHGRRQEQSELLGWCEDGNPGLSVRLLTGPGGQGKSRLTRWLVSALQQRSWVAGHLRADITDHPHAQLDLRPLATAAAQVMLVVDYAEARPNVVRSVIEVARTARRPVRLLLVARSDGAWRTEAMNASFAAHEILVGAPEIPLGPLESDGGRRAAFEVAVHDIARLLVSVPAHAESDWSVLAETVTAPSDLNAQQFSTALNLQMAALIALLQHKRGHTRLDVIAGEPVEATLLRHEERYWARTVPRYHGDSMASTICRHAVTAAVLCGAADRVEARAVVARIPDVPAEAQQPLTDWLRGLYPAEPSRFWGSLQPDRIAEFLVAEVVIAAPAMLPALLAGATEFQQAQAYAVAIRAVLSQTNAGRAGVGSTLVERLTSAWDDLISTRSLAPEAMRMIVNELRSSSHVLAPFALLANQSLLAGLRWLAQQQPGARANLRALLHNVARWLRDMGRYDESLELATEAMQLSRELVAEDAASEDELADSLVSLAEALGRARETREALAAAHEAVEIYQRLAAADRETHEGDLAMALTALSDHLETAGEASEALATSTAALDVLRRLEARDPDLYRADLARCLNSVSIQLESVGRLDEAVAFGWECTDIYRTLAVESPDEWESRLAIALHNLGSRLHALGQEDRIVEVIDEAVAIRRRLAAGNPDAYEDHFLSSLNNLSNALNDRGDHVAALAAIEEVVEIRRRRVADGDDHLAAFATALGNMSNLLWDVERHSESLVANDEAVTILRRLQDAGRLDNQADLGFVLNNYAVHLRTTGRFEEAVSLAGEASDIYQHLVTTDPVSYGPTYVTVLSSLADCLSSAGIHEHAAHAVGRSLAMCRELVSSRPGYGEQHLVGPLFRQYACFENAGRNDRAVGALMELTALYRRLTESEPDVYRPRLAALLRHTAGKLWDLNRKPEAIDLFEEDVPIYRSLALSDPETYAGEYATALMMCALAFAEAGVRMSEAKRQIEAAIEIYEQLDAAMPGRFDGDLQQARLALSVASSVPKRQRASGTRVE